MSYLLDTNALSEATTPRPDEPALAWLEAHEDLASVSAISLGEIWKGIELLPQGRRRRGFETWLISLDAEYADRIVAVDWRVMRKWGELCARHEKAGRKLPILDSLLAATALAHDLTLVTRNTADYPPEVRTLNPWRL